MTTNRAPAFIDSVGWAGLATNYYTECPREPVVRPAETIPIGTLHQVPAMTVQSLLDAVAKHAKKGENILIACHGTDHGPSLSLGQGFNLEVPGGLTELQKYEDGKLRASDIAKEFGWPPDQLEQFWTLLKEVRDLHLDRVEIRACNTGAKETVLKSLKNFFGCKRICAPKHITFYTPVDPGTVDSLNFDRTRRNKMRSAQVTGEKPNRFALETIIGDHGLSITVNALAESQQAVTNWIKAHLPCGGDWKGKLFHAEAIQIKGNSVAWSGDGEFLKLLNSA